MNRRLAAALLAILAVGLYFAWRELPLWRDTYFHVEDGGVIEFPSGHVVPTNRWITLESKMPKFALLQIGHGRNGEHHMIQNHDTNRVAALVAKDKHRRAVVTTYRGRGPSGIIEFWLRPDTQGEE
jgi:hypothetical protein